MNFGFVSVSGTAGGAEAHTVSLGRGLIERGHNVVLYGRCPGWNEQQLPSRDLGLGPKWSRSTLATGVLRVPLERRRIAAAARASAYYMQFKREQVALTHPLSRKAPVVWTEHGRWMGGATGRMLLKAYVQAAKQVSKVVCVSEAVAGDLARVIDRDKLVVIPNAIDTTRFAAPSPQRRAELRNRLLPKHFQDRPVAVLAARLHQNKRHDRAITATLAGASALIVVGDGPDRQRLENLANGHPDVVFAGFRTDVSDILAACDFYLYCGSPQDGLPTCVLEAAASGLPVVGFDGDVGIELVPRCGGLVIEEPRQLTKDLVANLLSRWGSGVSFVAENHGRDRWLDRYEAVLREVAA